MHLSDKQVGVLVVQLIYRITRHMVAVVVLLATGIHIQFVLVLVVVLLW